jgi:hypothetical protein
MARVKQEVVEKKSQQELSNLDEVANRYEQYGNQAVARPITGRLLKFSKGDYLAGQESEEIPVGTELVAVMDTLQVGWIKWEDNRPVDQVFGYLSDTKYVPLKRSELSDTDQSEWETGDDGKPRDPWQLSNQLILRPVNWTGDDDDLFTFVGSSRGVMGAIGELSKVYAKEMRQRPDDWPTIKLGVGGYNHSNKQFGRIKTPVLEVTGWTSKVVSPRARPRKVAAR